MTRSMCVLTYHIYILFHVSGNGFDDKAAVPISEVIRVSGTDEKHGGGGGAVTCSEGSIYMHHKENSALSAHVYTLTSDSVCLVYTD